MYSANWPGYLYLYSLFRQHCCVSNSLTVLASKANVIHDPSTDTAIRSSTSVRSALLTYLTYKVSKCLCLYLYL